MIERYTSRVFIPRYGTQRFDANLPRQVFFRTLDLASIESLRIGDQFVSRDSYFLYPETGPPYRWLEFDYQFYYDIYNQYERQKAISIVGWWGYADHTDMLTALTADADASATTLSVEEGIPLSRGMILRADDEMMLVTGYDGTAHTVKVRRGFNDTTAHDLTNGADLDRQLPPEDIIEACAVMTTRFVQRGKAGWSGELYGEDDQIFVSSTTPSELVQIMDGYRRL